MLAEYFHLNGYRYGSTVITVTGSIPKIISLMTICDVGSSDVSLILAKSFGRICGLFALGLAIIGFRKHFKLERKFFLIDASMLILGYLYFITILFAKHKHDMFATPTGQSDWGDIFLTPHAIAMLFAYGIYVLTMFLKLLLPAVRHWRQMEAKERRFRFEPATESAPLRTHFKRFRQAIDPNVYLGDISRWFFYPTVSVITIGHYTHTYIKESPNTTVSACKRDQFLAEFAHQTNASHQRRIIFTKKVFFMIIELERPFFC